MSFWMTPHPGGVADEKGSRWHRTETHEQAIEKWFEGVNVPRRFDDNGAAPADPFAVDCERVRAYFRQHGMAAATIQ